MEQGLEIMKGFRRILVSVEPTIDTKPEIDLLTSTEEKQWTRSRNNFSLL
jgi:hypothetical protein